MHWRETSGSPDSGLRRNDVKEIRQSAAQTAAWRLLRVCRGFWWEPDMLPDTFGA
jgi:hypothetical protein